MRKKKTEIITEYYSNRFSNCRSNVRLIPTSLLFSVNRCPRPRCFSPKARIRSFKFSEHPALHFQLEISDGIEPADTNGRCSRRYRGRSAQSSLRVTQLCTLPGSAWSEQRVTRRLSYYPRCSLRLEYSPPCKVLKTSAPTKKRQSSGILAYTSWSYIRNWNWNVFRFCCLQEQRSAVRGDIKSAQVTKKWLIVFSNIGYRIIHIVSCYRRR